METSKVERLDHLGIIASVIKDLGIIEIIDRRIEPDSQQEVTTGEAVAAMIINGLGFSNRPLYLTPQFFENKPMALLFREGVEAEHFNRSKLGRSLDAVYRHGADQLFSEITVVGCQQEQVDLRFNSLDTSSFSLTGAYNSETDEQAVKITYGHSKDHRPDLKQVVLELMVSQDGGVPILSKAWDGNAADTVIFKQRAEGLINELKNTESPRYLIADSKLYTEENSKIIKNLSYITRIPGTLNLESQLIQQVLNDSDWQSLDDGYRYQRIELGHYGIDQRWLVIYSDAAEHRAQVTLDRAQQKEAEQLKKQLFHLQAQRFSSPLVAQAALDKIALTLHYHDLVDPELTQYDHYKNRGRPKNNSPLASVQWSIQVRFQINQEAIHRARQQKACFILGTNIPIANLTDHEVFTAYKKQSSVERGFRFLKDPLFFVSSLFIKKPERIQALLMIMTLALFVYSMAQRRLRQQLKDQQETLPNQLNQPTATPTLRWVFQMLDGIHRVVTTSLEGVKQIMMEGLTQLRIKILKLFGPRVRQLYQIDCC
jgi:transposase